jgi:hypothetical protein
MSATRLSCHSLLDSRHPINLTANIEIWSRDLIRTLPSAQHDPDRPEDLDTSGEDHALDDARYACMSRPYIARPIERKPSDHVVLMAGADGRVNYFRADDDGKPEIVDVKDVVLNYCRRKERERRRETW